MIFLYKTTNKLNNKFYIGVHDGDETDDYLGSGKYLKSAIKKYGADNFSREILAYFATKEAAYLAEKDMVTPELIKSGTVYNLNTGGHGGWHHAIKYGKDNVMSRPEVAAKVSASIKSSITHEERKRRSDGMKIMRANGTVVKPKGWTHSEETRRKISIALTGKPNSNKGKNRFPDTAETKINKSSSAKKRAQTQDIGALTRGKIRSPKISCIHCKNAMYEGRFTDHITRGKCWK